MEQNTDLTILPGSESQSKQLEQTNTKLTVRKGLEKCEELSSAQSRSNNIPIGHRPPAPTHLTGIVTVTLPEH